MYDTTHEYKLDESLMEKNCDDMAVDEFAKAMKEKLAKARAKESAVMELAKKYKEIEKLKKHYHQCLDDYIKCTERHKEQ